MPGKLLTYLILKSGYASTNFTVKSGKLLTIFHLPHSFGNASTVSTRRSSKLLTICTLKSAKLSTTRTRPYSGMPLHLQSLVMGLSVWQRYVATINIKVTSFIGSKIMKNK